MNDLQTADSVRAVPEVHRKAIIVDGHCDTPYRLKRKGLTLSDPDPNAQVDLQRLRESGLTASFFVSYVPPFYAGRGAANFARQLMDIIHGEVAAHQDLLVFVADSASIRKAKSDGKVGILIGVEGGHAIEDSLEILREFYQRGARYLTLTHINTNNWADSSGDVARHNGLTDFGRDVVRTMNDLGMMVDISHVSDKTFYNALETSRAPIFASHSSCRAIAGHPRNLTDPMLRDLAAGRGLCMINFYTAFVSDKVAKTMARAQKRTRKDRDAALTANEELPDDHTDWEAFVDWYESLNAPNATIDEVIDHIVHAASVAGVDAVGIGSDFDGVPALPEGITDISFLPALTQRLIDRKFSDDEILKILGENFLRVFGEVEKARR